jgi:formylmethanofuran dehydrogenase subunit E
VERLRIDPERADLGQLIERGTHLHGHLGPFLIAGIRMGLLALKLLESGGYFGIEARSESGTIPPLSCLIDGVQIGTGCTLGKGNIQVTEERRPRVHFSSTSGKQVTIELRPDAYEGFSTGELGEQCAVAREGALEEILLWSHPQ